MLEVAATKKKDAPISFATAAAAAATTTTCPTRKYRPSGCRPQATDQYE